MLKFEKFELANGLRVIVHTDNSTPLACVNVLYNVGARDEDPDKTGFAHLFEHLMFGGSGNVANYDEPIQLVGGMNNAFTTNDITNYYINLPLANIETAFWLESDRMLQLAFSPRSLDVQRKVVIEEFKQRNLNQPYGDLWLLLRPLAYKVHPYRWSTIGMEISHIENASMEDVRDFYERFYHPRNAILSVVGNISPEQVQDLAEKWFSPISKGKSVNRNLPIEPEQTEARFLHVERDVPADLICLAYHLPPRTHDAFYHADMMSDILSSGNSSRLYRELVKDKQLFSELDAYITTDVDGGLFLFIGQLNRGIDMKIAEDAIKEQINRLRDQKVSSHEIDKSRNKIESALAFADISLTGRAFRMAYAEWMGDAERVNSEVEKYLAVTADDIIDTAQTIFMENKCSSLHYMAKK